MDVSVEDVFAFARVLCGRSLLHTTTKIANDDNACWNGQSRLHVFGGRESSNPCLFLTRQAPKARTLTLDTGPTTGCEQAQIYTASARVLGSLMMTTSIHYRASNALMLLLLPPTPSSPRC